VRGADLWYLASAPYLKKRVKELLFLTLDKRQQDAALIVTPNNTEILVNGGLKDR